MNEHFELMDMPTDEANRSRANTFDRLTLEALQKIVERVGSGNEREAVENALINPVLSLNQWQTVRSLEIEHAREIANLTTVH